MELADALNRDDFPKSGTFQANLDYLSLPCAVDDPTYWTVGVLEQIFTLQSERDAVCNAFIQSGLASSYVQGLWLKFCGVGLPFNSDRMQSTIDQMAATFKWPDNIAPTLKALGRRVIPYWQELQIPVEPTIDTVKKTMLMKIVSSIAYGVSYQICNGGIAADYTTIKAAIDKQLDDSLLATGS